MSQSRCTAIDGIVLAIGAIPTLKEQGIAGCFNTWRALWAPKGLRAARIAFWYWDGVLERKSRDALCKETLDANRWESDYKK